LEEANKKEDERNYSKSKDGYNRRSERNGIVLESTEIGIQNDFVKGVDWACILKSLIEQIIKKSSGNDSERWIAGVFSLSDYQDESNCYRYDFHK
jgi:hypothetical protein